ASLAAGKPVAVTEVASLADSLGGGIGLDNRHSLALCRDHLDYVVLVTEEEIYRAMQAHYFEDRLVCEGASAVGAAALMAGKIASRPGPTATLITGRNVDMAVFSAIMRGADVTLGDYRITGVPYAA
ncbi:MAG: pyridoxal-phosphate dependent enzyme, partial [Nitratireductor sp.]